MRVVSLILLLLWFVAPVWSQEEAETEETIHYPNITHQGQVQLQLNTGGLGSSRAGSFSPINNGVGSFPADDKIFFRRVRPVWVVEFSPNLELDTEFEFDFEERRIEILDLLLKYDFSDETALSVGRYKVPFGWEGLRSSQTINTVERSDATVYFYPERDVGVMLSHEQPGLGEFALGTFLGQPRSNGDSNGGLELIGRASFQVTDQLKLGASGHLGNFRPTGTTLDIPVRRVGGELQWESGPFRVESEAIFSSGYNTANQGDTRAFGYYLSGIYRIAESLELVLSYDRFDPDLDSRSHLSVSNRTDDRDRKVIGLNYYLSREPIHRVMLNYEMRQSLEGAPVDTQGFRLRYQVAW